MCIPSTHSNQNPNHMAVGGCLKLYRLACIPFGAIPLESKRVTFLDLDTGLVFELENCQQLFDLNGDIVARCACPARLAGDGMGNVLLPPGIWRVATV